MRSSHLVALTCMVWQFARLVLADTDFSQSRRHFEVVGKTGVRYSMTAILLLSESEDREQYLVKDAQGHRYTFTHARSYEEQTAMWELMDLKSGAFVRSTYAYPFKARTRQGTIAEARALASTEASLTITLTTGSLTRTVSESDWKGDSGRQLRTDLRQSTDPDLLEALESMRGGLLAVGGISDFCHPLAALLLHGDACDREGRLARRPLKPDCDFDRDLGFPCSSQQRERIEAASRESRLLEHY